MGGSCFILIFFIVIVIVAIVGLKPQRGDAHAPNLGLENASLMTSAFRILSLVLINVSVSKLNYIFKKLFSLLSLLCSEVVRSCPQDAVHRLSRGQLQAAGGGGSRDPGRRCREWSVVGVMGLDGGRWR